VHDLRLQHDSGTIDRELGASIGAALGSKQANPAACTNLLMGCWHDWFEIDGTSGQLREKHLVATGLPLALRRPAHA
jgi:hypothetical protein